MSTRKSSQRAQSRFARIPDVSIQRSAFDRTHGVKTTMNAGYLVPIYVDEVVPGDTFSCNLTHFARLATPRTSIFDNLTLDFFFFFVPCRLVWENWQKFMGEQANPGDSIDYEIPQVVAPSGGYEEMSVYDYMGLPTKVENISASALPARAYRLIYNEWFRDQDLQDSVGVPMDDGPDNPVVSLKRRGKRHDYFTSCKPWPIKGGVEVRLPISGQAPLAGNASVYPQSGPLKFIFPDAMSGAYLEGRNDPDDVRWDGQTSLNPEQAELDPMTQLGHAALNEGGGFADLSQATGVTINELRESAVVQQLLERDARSGTRYIELIKGHFGVTSPDARLQRPEYIGGGSTRVNINPVPQTSETGTSPQGNIAAFGTAVGTAGFRQSFVEHGYIIGLACLRADLNYQQGMRRMWSRKDREEFLWPEFSNLGEQEVYSREIYADGSPGDDEIWGYQERYGEYRTMHSQITGLMRSNADQSLDVWHLAQDFDARPELDATFIEEDPPVDRVSAVTDQPHLLLDMYVNLRCVRPLPMYSVPGITRL